ncbi:MAG: hypothetical protein AAF194_06100, partial [Pseudomonadota bacterium]
LINIYALMGLGVIATAVLAWRRPAGDPEVGGVMMKSHLSLLALAALASWPGLFLFNLIGFQY